MFSHPTIKEFMILLSDLQLFTGNKNQRANSACSIGLACNFGALKSIRSINSVCTRTLFLKTDS